MWRIEFTTDKFLPYLPEECQSNPGAYGFELAHWLSQQLAQRGLNTGYPVGEDWGWFIQHLDGQTEITVGCSSEAAEGDGYKSQPVRWRVFVRQPLSLTQRLKGSAAPIKVREIADAVVALLRSEDISVTVSEA